MAFGVLLRQQWISGYIEFVPDWSELPVGVSVSINIDATRALDSHGNISTVSSVAIDATRALDSHGNVSAMSSVAIDATRALDSHGNVSAMSSVAIDATRALDSHGNVSAMSSVAIDATRALDSHGNVSTVSSVAINATRALDSHGNVLATAFDALLRLHWDEDLARLIPGWMEFQGGGYSVTVTIDAAKALNSDGNISVLSNIAFDKTFLSGPGSGTADAYGFTNLLETLTTSNNAQAAITLLTTLSKTMVTDQRAAAYIASGTNLRCIIAITPSLVPPPPLFKNLYMINAECSDLLDIEPSDELTERGEFEQTTMETDSGLTYVVTSRPTPKYYVTLQWKGLKQNDVDKVTSIYFTTTKAFGRARSFKWKHPVDNKVYVVRFIGDLNTDRRAEITNRESIGSIQLEILGISAN